MPSLRYRGWGDGVARIPSFSFAGYLVAVFVGLFAGTMTFLALASLNSHNNGHVASFRQVANAASEVVQFSITFSLFAFGPVALVGAVVLVPTIVWATRAGVRSAGATAVAGAAVISLLVLVPTLLIARNNGSPTAITTAFAFMPTGMAAALSYRTVTLYRFGGGSASRTNARELATRTGSRSSPPKAPSALVGSAHGYDVFGSSLIHQDQRTGFSWLAYAAACAIGTLAGGLVLVLGPLAWEIAAIGPGAEPPLGVGSPLEALRGLLLITLGASALLIPVAMLVLAPVALPLLATLHRRGRIGAWAAVLGGTGCAAIGALLAALVGIDAPLVPPELDPAPLVAGTVLALALVAIPGALAGLTYRAVARRRGRL